MTYVPCVLEGDPQWPYAVGPLDAVAAARAQRIGEARAYLCGDPDLVARTRKKLFLAGARLGDIHADPFVTAPPPA